MSKKKAIKLLDEADICFTGYIRNWCRDLVRMGLKKLREAQEELLYKSDWVSVEEELPPYEEDVLVCNKNEPSDIWFGHRTSDRRVVVDEHEFAKEYGTITHWHKIDKLED